MKTEHTDLCLLTYMFVFLSFFSISFSRTVPLLLLSHSFYALYDRIGLFSIAEFRPIDIGFIPTIKHFKVVGVAVVAWLVSSFGGVNNA